MYHSKLASVLLICFIALSLCNGDSIYPKTLRTQSGSASSTPLTAMRTEDLTGDQDSWAKYVEFYGSNKAYQGVFTFDASSLNVATVGAYSLEVNYKGPKKTAQVWQFEWYQVSTDTWLVAGDNADAASWLWTPLSFCGEVPFSTLIKDGSIQVRYSSKTAFDDSDLDYLAITTTSGDSSATAAPTTPATAAPTAPATAAPTVPATSAPTTRPTTPATAAPTAAPTTRPTTVPSAAPTTKPTSAPTAAPTAAPTTRPTNAPTAAPTTRPTIAPTTKPTTAPTTKPTTAPTSAPTTRPTSAPTTRPTTAPTAAPTIAPTTKPTTKPTTAPTTPPSTAAPGGRMCAAGKVWSPAPGTTWQWQLTGTIDQSLDVQMYDIDLFDATASLISSLHSKGRAVICYFSTQYEDWRPDASKFTSSVLGNNLDDWPGERFADIRSSVLRKIMTDRLDLALSKGCDGVEPDNVDSYANSNGLGLKAADQLDFNKFLATESHKRGLSVGLKNDLDQVSALVSSFDWALNEQCNEYGECSMLNPFVSAGKAVFGVDYTGSASKVCPNMVTAKMSWLMKDLNLGAGGTQCCTYASGGCAKVPYSCVSYSSKRSDGAEELIDEVVADPQLVDEDFAPIDNAASTMIPAVAITVAAIIAMVL